MDRAKPWKKKHKLKLPKESRGDLTKKETVEESWDLLNQNEQFGEGGEYLPFGEDTVGVISKVIVSLIHG